MLKIIITGGSGFVGKNLLPIIAATNHKYYLLDMNTYTTQYDNIEVVKCNLLDNGEVNKKIENIKATHLLHLAWGMSPSNYNLDINFDWLKSSMNLLEQFQKNGGERVIIAGSGVEYNWDFGCCKEDVTPISHETLYGSTKNILRQYATDYCKHHGLSFVWPRLFFLYGPHEHPDRLISHIICSLLKKEKATILNGEIYRDYFYIKDTVNVLSQLIQNDYSGILNVSSGIPVKLGNVGELIAELMDRRDLLEIKTPSVSKRKVVFANTERLVDDFRYNYQYDLKEGITETINWWKENGDLWRK